MCLEYDASNGHEEGKDYSCNPAWLTKNSQRTMRIGSGTDLVSEFRLGVVSDLFSGHLKFGSKEHLAVFSESQQGIFGKI